ncbi:CHAT domain-containing protein, partial [Frankia sp. KB5]
LACHGFAVPADPAASHLELADGRPLTARELLAEQSAATRVERVFLAACSTNVTGADYDEAFSIATAFLAAGARTVYGSLWDLPDRYTATMMFVLHHNLVVEDCSPAEAMQAAQDWALDPYRTAPATMPGPVAAAMVDDAWLPFVDPAAWAGLVHLGA